MGGTDTDSRHRLWRPQAQIENRIRRKPIALEPHGKDVGQFRPGSLRGLTRRRPPRPQLQHALLLRPCRVRGARHQTADPGKEATDEKAIVVSH